MSNSDVPNSNGKARPTAPKRPQRPDANRIDGQSGGPRSPTRPTRPQRSEPQRKPPGAQRPPAARPTGSPAPRVREGSDSERRSGSQRRSATPSTRPERSRTPEQTAPRRAPSGSNRQGPSPDGRIRGSSRAGVSGAKQNPKKPASRAQRRKIREASARSAVSRRPKILLGLIWALVTVVAVLTGGLGLALWVALIAGVGATQLASRWSRIGWPASPAAAGLAELAVALFAVKGPAGLGLGLCVGLLISGCVVLASSSATKSLSSILVSFAASVPLGIAAGSLVVVREFDVMLALLLLGFALAYDYGSYSLGFGVRFRVVGLLGGLLALLPVAILCSVLAPYEGKEWQVLSAIAAVGIPVGVLLGQLLSNPKGAWRRDVKVAPGIARLDSLLVLAPAWMVAIHFIL